MRSKNVCVCTPEGPDVPWNRLGTKEVGEDMFLIRRIMTTAHIYLLGTVSKYLACFN